jgi:hypothetical protein
LSVFDLIYILMSLYMFSLPQMMDHFKGILKTRLNPYNVLQYIQTLPLTTSQYPYYSQWPM